jgi:hypothetical protein
MYEEKLEQKQKYIDYLKLSPGDRLLFKKENKLKTDEDLHKYCGISGSLAYKIKKKFDLKEPEVSSVKSILNSEENRQVLAKHLLSTIKKGSPSAMKLALDLMNELDKKEVKSVEFTPTDRIKFAESLRESLNRRLQDTGDCPICHRPMLLVEQVCVHNEREQKQDDQVAAVELPLTPCPIIPGGTRNRYTQGSAVGDIVAGDGLRPVAGSIPQ